MERLRRQCLRQPAVRVVDVEGNELEEGLKGGEIFIEKGERGCMVAVG